MEELTIEVFQAQFGGSDYTILRLFEGIRGLQRARVFGSVAAFPEYTAWLERAITSPKGADVVEYRAGSEEIGATRNLWTEFVVR